MFPIEFQRKKRLRSRKMNESGCLSSVSKEITQSATLFIKMVEESPKATHVFSLKVNQEAQQSPIPSPKIAVSAPPNPLNCRSNVENGHSKDIPITKAPFFN